jgi:hypothetical protein
MTEPLSVRMRIAANTLEEFNTHRTILYPSDTPWRPSELRREARHVEDEEQEATEREMLAEQLADDLSSVFSHADTFGPVAHWLIENGWRKDDI